jgi:hypothetical protein
MARLCVIYKDDTSPVLDESIHFFTFCFGTAAGRLGAQDVGSNWPNCSTVQRLGAALVQTKGFMSSFLRRKVVSPITLQFDVARALVRNAT